MSFFHDYQPSTSHSPHDDYDSDAEDLTLDELNDTGSKKQQRRDVQQRSPRLQLSRLRPRVLHNNGKKVEGSEQEDLGDLLDPTEEPEDTGASIDEGGDNAPLLGSAQDASPGVRPTKMLSRTASVTHLWAKLQSNPRDEEEEGYDPISNRVINIGQQQKSRYPPNAVSNAKYTPWSFLPRTLYNEFSFFFNLYFLLVALSQIIPPLRIGYLSTYVAPLAFVLTITLGKEAIDDIGRRRRDKEANSERYTVLSFRGTSEGLGTKKQAWRKKGSTPSRDRLKGIAEEEEAVETTHIDQHDVGVQEITKPSRDLKVGDVIKLEKDARVPVDAVILKSMPRDAGGNTDSDSGGEAFIRTDQLDGETDWKLRLAPALTQVMNIEDFASLQIEAGKPEKKVNEFIGSISIRSQDASGDESGSKAAPLTIDNTAWANTVIASSAYVYAAVVYTGPQTRQALSTSASRSKTGLLEFEINSLTKVLCALTLVLSLLLVVLENIGANGSQDWYIAVMRFLILFSTIVPISLRVNLDMAKSVYAWFIEHDPDIPETVVRTSTIPEDLGRIEYLLSDKTGTLTQNDMQLKKIHVGTVSYAHEAMSEVVTYVRQGFGGSENKPSQDPSLSYATATRSRREIGSRVRDIVLALALCHNVTPTVTEEGGKSITSYQASSPDEIAIVSWTESVGLKLAHRDRHTMLLKSTQSGRNIARVRILNIFPFTSEGKRMGIILKFLSLDEKVSGHADDEDEGPIWFYQKGADTVMSPIVAANDWLDEETANMAREGLRTLVIGRKKLSTEVYEEFSQRYRDASVDLLQRDIQMSQILKEYLEQDLELLGVSGVEDKLQHDVKPSLELLRNAGIKIWMLTGDKVETARCVAVSARLVTRGQYIHTITKMTNKRLAMDSLEFLHNKPDACLLIDGESLALMLSCYREVFVRAAVRLPAVIACRCSPNQKADVAQLIRAYTKKRICCIGDGGNDVSMIQAADVGIGIVGKEGRQASLAADFSVLQFCHITKLLAWHGRNSYKRSAKLAQFVIHRGLIISVCQTVFSVASRFEPVALYRDWLLVGYATLYTMFPVFALVLDTDIPPQLAHLYPELYAELSTSRSLSYRTFFEWVAISVYQGCVIQLLAHALVGLADFKRMVSVSYTALVLNELLMVAAEVTTWHWLMAVSLAGTALMFLGSFPLLGDYLDLGYVVSLAFLWRVAVILGVSLVPVFGTRFVRRMVSPPNYRKVQQGL